MKASQKTTTKEPSLNKKYGFVIMQLSAKKRVRSYFCRAILRWMAPIKMHSQSKRKTNLFSSKENITREDFASSIGFCRTWYEESRTYYRF